MTLTLHIVSSQARAMGDAASHQFDEKGGSIGRLDGNDWILPDAERYVSRRHAKISHDHGSWYILDDSTDGTFVNDPEYLIGNGHRVPLSDGDRLYIGDYEILVSIADAETTATTGRTYVPVSDESEQIDADSSFPKETHDELEYGVHDARQNVDPIKVLDESDDNPFFPNHSSHHAHDTAPAESDDVKADDVYGDDPDEVDPMKAYESSNIISEASQPQHWPKEHGSTSDHASVLEQSFTPPRVERNVIQDNFDETIFPDSEQTVDKARQSPLPSPPPEVISQAQQRGEHKESDRNSDHQNNRESSTDSQSSTTSQATPVARQFDPTRRTGHVKVAQQDISALNRLLMAAGVDPQRMPPEAANAVFELVGSAFREMVEGIMGVLRARNELKNLMPIDKTVIQTTENNPLKWSVSTDEAMDKLLFPEKPGYMAPVEALREATDDIKAHQLAVMAGLSAAIQTILGQFDPEKLETEFKKTLKHSKLASLLGEAKYWDLYREKYQELVGDSRNDILELYGEEFADAYQEQIDKLS